MNTTTPLALAFASFASLTAAAAAAEEREGPHGMFGPGAMKANFERADTDKSGDVTYQEFAAVFGERFKKADSNANGELTVEEVADGIERMMAEQMAMRVIGRLDVDDDGKLTTAEVESQQKKLFALGDRNDDGKIAESELPDRKGGKRGWWGHDGR